MTLWQMFAATAARFPDRIAIEPQRRSTGDAWTYRGLHDAAVAAAGRLASIGVGPRERCAILADDHTASCAAYLAILRAGAIVVPLDPKWSAEQVTSVVRDTSARVVFVTDRLEPIAREALRRQAGVVICSLSRELFVTGGRPDEEEPDGPATRSADIAVILFTAGTTADPKGVALSHANLMAARAAASAVVPVNQHDSVMTVLPLSHPVGHLVGLLLPLLSGARIVVVEEGHDRAELARALSEPRVTIFACAPEALADIHQRLMTEAARRGFVEQSLAAMLKALTLRLRAIGCNLGPTLFRQVHGTTGRRMRLVVVGGSKSDPAIDRDLYALGFSIVHAYGLAETSGPATMTTPGDLLLHDVGHALPGQEVRIIPEQSSEADGEVAIRGPIVMQGYFNRPDATNAVMRDGWLLTGDLGRLDARGRLTIAGRRKEVIVLATGERVNPEEVENCYRQSPFVKEICVVGPARDGEAAPERLYAVVVPDMELMRARRVANAGDLIRFEMEGQSVQLPAAKRVRDYEVWFEPLPRTTTGQLKRHEIEPRLRQKQRNAPSATSEPDVAGAQGTSDPYANAVIDILRRRAGGVPFHRGSNLELELGLDSIERVEVLVEVEQRFGVKVPDEDAHNILTVEQLIDVVRPGVLADQLATDAWAVLLRDLPPASDPLLASLLERRPVMSRLLFGLLRLLGLALLRVEATGIERLPVTGPYIISPNHQGYLDPFFVCSVLPYRIVEQLFFVGAAEYFESPITAWFARQCNLVAVNPDAHLVPAMKAGAFGLSHGKILVLFPEGERSIDGTVKRFKKGGAILSRYLNAPIVPVAIHGAYEVWPRNRAVNWRLLLPWSGHRVRIAFGAPLTFDTSLTKGEAATALRGKVQAMWEPLSVSGRATRTTS